MRRNIDFDEEHWDTLKVIAHDMGYNSRQTLVQAVIRSFVDQFPMAKLRAIDEHAVRKAKRELKEDWKDTVKLGPVSQDELKELAGDIFPEMFEPGHISDLMVTKSPEIYPVSDVIVSSLNEAESPQLPEL